MEAIPEERSTTTKKNQDVLTFNCNLKKKKSCKQNKTTHLASVLLEDQVRLRVWPQEKFCRAERKSTEKSCDFLQRTGGSTERYTDFNAEIG